MCENTDLVLSASEFVATLRAGHDLRKMGFYEVRGDVDITEVTLWGIYLGEGKFVDNFRISAWVDALFCGQARFERGFYIFESGWVANLQLQQARFEGDFAPNYRVESLDFGGSSFDVLNANYNPDVARLIAFHIGTDYVWLRDINDLDCELSTA